MLTHNQDKQKRIEIDLRGEVLYHTSLIESFLAKIILFIKWEQQDLTISKITYGEMKFTKKINKVKNLFEIYYPELIKSNKVLFEDLDKVAKFRNKIAHCLITWDDNILDYFYYWDIQINEEDGNMYAAIKMTIDDAINEFNFIVSTGNQLLQIAQEFKNRFDLRFPKK